MSLEQEIGGMAADLLTELEAASYGDDARLEVGVITVAISSDQAEGSREVGYHQILAGSGSVFPHEAEGLLNRGLDLLSQLESGSRSND